jgi:hypothetical protein
MTQLGYTLMCEQSGPRELVRDATRAEQVGVDRAEASRVAGIG